MKNLAALIAATFAIGVVLSGGLQAQQTGATPQSIVDLDWKRGPETFTVKPLKGTIRVRSDEAFVQGKDAREYVRLGHGRSDYRPDAVVFKLKGPFERSVVIYEHIETGHVEMDDWDQQIRPEELLAEIRRANEEDNKKRPPGYDAVYTDGWIEEPYIDRENAVAYWAYRLHNDKGEQFVNAQAVELTRNGFTSLSWVGTAEQFASTQQNLIPALRAYDIDKGQRYADFEPGSDKVAKAGIGAIVFDILTGNKTGD